MKDKDSRLIYEAYEKRDDDPRGKYHDDVAFRTHAWDEEYLGHNLDAIRELVDFLESNFEEGTHYKLHIERGDDLPNTVSIHKQLETSEWGRRHLDELLDAASGPPQGEGYFDGDEDDDWFDHDDEGEEDTSYEFEAPH